MVSKLALIYIKSINFVKCENINLRKKYKNINLLPLTVPAIATVPTTTSIKSNQSSNDMPVGTGGWWNGSLGQDKVGAALK